MVASNNSGDDVQAKLAEVFGQIKLRCGVEFYSDKKAAHVAA